MKGTVILVEDDPQQSASICAAVKRYLRDMEVEVIETESEFYARLDGMTVAATKPSVLICDVMLPWAFPDPNAPQAPAEVLEGSFRKAGIRCWERLRKRRELSRIPWIYFTVLSHNTIDYERFSDDRTGYAQKSASIEPLLREMDELMHVDDEWRETAAEVTQRLMALPESQRRILDSLSARLGDCASALP